MDLRGRRAGRWTIQKKLGRGGMASVWLASDDSPAGDVAIKVFAETHANTFEAEAAAMAGLAHPNIIRVLDFGRLEDPPLPYLAMELARGSALDAFAATKPISWNVVANVMRSVLEALAHAHARGLIHRDLKPANIFAANAAGTRWRLGDFGIARRVADVEGNLPPSGTPAYMAPEQFTGHSRDLGPWTDLYSLGCVLYALTTGAPPFGREGAAFTLAFRHMRDEVPPLEPRFEVPEGLEDFLAVLLRKDPIARFRAAADALRAFEALPRVKSSGATMVLGDDTTLVTPAFEPTLQLGDLSDFRWTVDSDLEPPKIERPPPPVQAPDGDFTATYRLLRGDASAALSRMRRLPLVGRRGEREKLWSQFRSSSIDRKRTIAFLSGEPGVGKTAVARWLAHLTMEYGYANAFEFRNEGMKRAVARFVRDRYRIEGLSIEEAVTRIVRRGNLPTWAADQLVEISLPDTAATRETVDAVCAAIAAESQRRPVIVLLDDIDSSSVGQTLLARFASLPAGTGPILVVAAGHAPPPDALEVDLHLPIGPLPSGECMSFVGALTNAADNLTRSITTRVGGNPRLALEVITSWVEEGFLVRDGEYWTLRDGVDPQLPNSVDDLRLDQLRQLIRNDDDQLVLEVLAFLGGETKLQDWLDACRAAGVGGAATDVLRAGLGTVLLAEGEQLAFAEPGAVPLLTDKAKARGTHIEAHEAVAAVIEERPADFPPDALGRHLFAAGHYARALEPLVVGAESVRSADPLAARQLLDHVETARGMVEGELPRREVERCSIRAQLVRASIVGREGRLDDSLDMYLAAADRADAAGLRTLACEARVIFLDSGMLHRADESTAKLAKDVIAETRALGDANLIGRALIGAGGVFGYMARLDEAEEIYQQAIALANGRQDTSLRAHALYGIGWVAFLRGEYQNALDPLKAAADAFRQVDDESHAIVVEAFAGDVYRALGELDRAETLYKRCLEFHLVTGHTSPQMSLNLGIVELSRGHYEEAVRWAKRSLDSRGIRRGVSVETGASACECVLAAATSDPEYWDTSWRRVTEALRDHPDLVQYDLTYTLDLAAREALTTLDADRATAAVNLAVEFWRRLGRDQEADALEQRAG